MVLIALAILVKTKKILNSVLLHFLNCYSANAYIRLLFLMAINLGLKILNHNSM